MYQVSIATNMSSFVITYLMSRCCHSYLSINKVIFAYNVLLDSLEDFQDDMSKSPHLRSAANVAQLKLQEYYSRTDLSNVYAVATALDPCLKFNYWSEKGWEQEYVDEAISKVKTEWDKFKPRGPIVANDSTGRSNYKVKRVRVMDDLEAYLNEPLQATDDFEVSDQDGESDVNDLGVGQVEVIEESDNNDDFETDHEKNAGSGARESSKERRQEAEERRKESADREMRYWRHASGSYKQLSLMARKFLAIPATSTSCERLFSRARQFIPASRNRMTTDSLRESVLVDAWSRMEL